MITQVIKYDGSSEPYNEEKIRNSATRVGVPLDLQSEMLVSIRDRLFSGITTKEIFTMIKEFLRSAGSVHLAMKYNLKNSLAELGPSGYPFEKYLSLLLREEGYETKINQTIKGYCVSHEVDVLATKANITYFIEAKFHKNPSQRTDVRVALYIRARAEDLDRNWPGGETRPWIVTNTRFSTDAITYGECQKIKLTSWRVPAGDSIADIIERTGLHPITIIEDLSPSDKIRLLTSGVVTCKQLLDPANHYLMSKDLQENILPNISKICQNQK